MFASWLFAGRESTGSSKELDRAKLVRERQNEERQRKLEELRQQALAAQRFREQREEERRRRIDELRSRDNDRFVDFENAIAWDYDWSNVVAWLYDWSNVVAWLQSILLISHK